MIEYIENTECVSEYSTKEAPLVIYSSLIASKEDELGYSNWRYIEKYGSWIFSYW